MHGVSTGQMRQAVAALVGEQGARGLSANVVSRLKRSWDEEYRQWCRRRLDDEWVYLWADGIYSGLRGERERLCVLVVKLASWKVSVAIANHPLAPVGQLLLDERRQVLIELRRNRGLDQPPRAGSQKLRQRVGNPCWRRQRNHSIVAHVRCAPLAETVTFTTRFQQRHAARLNSSRHHFRP